MDSESKICGVILSAGTSSRMGRDKALLPWPPDATGSHTLLSTQIDALKPFTDAIIVVAGKNFDALCPIAAANGSSIMQNPQPERGQFSSLQVGLRELIARGFDAAIITLVDAPPLSSVTLEKLRTAFDEAVAKGIWGVAPEKNGKRGHPLLASRKLIDAFLAAPVTSNARTIKHEHAHLIESIPVQDALLSAEINTPEEYAALSLARQSRN